eukprot:GILI01003796.1.p1 GENE.GILI01003796.1~~GILI01003796.1.p1  ORF type:complete len:230 (-),score=22.60 GILI01003796.1:175-864(-)
MSIVGRVYSRALSLERVCRKVALTMAAAKEEEDGDIGDTDSFPPVECVMDRSLALEVGHNHVLQVLGRIVHNGFRINRKGLEKRDRDPDAPFAIDSDILYALRGATAAVAKSKNSEEWLYEVSQLSSIDPILVAVNNAMIDFVSNLTKSPSSGVHLMAAEAPLAATAESEVERRARAREVLHLALNRATELPKPPRQISSTPLPFTWGEVALDAARMVSEDLLRCEYDY